MTREYGKGESSRPVFVASVNDVIKIIDAHKTEINEKFQVESLAVFGSISRGAAGQESDVDILVRYKKTPGFFAFLELKKYLEILMGRSVDLVTEGALKKQLRTKILREAVRVV
jgi:predicted nucleotidyltransferase